MDNWGEGVVPACREERSQRFFFSIQFLFVSIIFLLFSIEQSPISVAERPSTAPVNMSISENIDRIQRPSTGSSITSSIRTPRSSSQSRKLSKINESNNFHQQFKQEQSIKIDSDNRTLTQKESSTGQTTSQSSFEQKPYYHDILVIHTQPPKVNNNYKKSKNSLILFIF
jgi:hypothetical protein